ncbi:MAG: hypothetical protein ACOCP9_04875 [Halofilum sp. (in: g-proteobacteria)]
MNAISGGRTVPRPWRLGCIAICLLIMSPLAAADVSVRGRIGGTVGGDPRPGLGIDLHVQRSDLAVRYADDSGGDRLKVGRIGLRLFESPAPGVQLGLSLGRQGVSQSGRSTTAGLDPAGYFVGFDALGRWGITRRLSLELAGRFAYGEASDRTGDETLELDWWSTTLRPAATLTLAERVELHAGVRAQWLDGEERVTDGARSTTGFREDRVAGGFVGIGLLTGRGGRVHLRADTGPARGLSLVFERRY